VSDFANLRDAGLRLGSALADAYDVADVTVLAAVPNGVPVALGIREAWAVDVQPLPVTRSDEGAEVAADPALAGRRVIVVDDGVETGTVARAAAAALRASGVDLLVLAVPVCPREAMADLALRYDDVIALVKPLARRDLAWHYADFDTVDEATAQRLLGDLPGGAP